MGKEDSDTTVPAPIVTSDDVYRHVKEHPYQKIGKIQALFEAVRLGIAAFAKSYGEDWEEIGDEDEEGKPLQKFEGKLKLEDILHIRDGDSWGPVTEKDPKV